jgi:hypothetical protein
MGVVERKREQRSIFARQFHAPAHRGRARDHSPLRNTNPFWGSGRSRRGEQHVGFTARQLRSPRRAGRTQFQRIKDPNAESRCGITDIGPFAGGHQGGRRQPPEGCGPPRGSHAGPYRRRTTRPGYLERSDCCVETLGRQDGHPVGGPQTRTPKDPPAAGHQVRQFSPGEHRAVAAAYRRRRGVRSAPELQSAGDGATRWILRHRHRPERAPRHWEFVHGPQH